MFYETEKSEYFDMQKDLIYKWEHTHRKKYFVLQFESSETF